MERIIELNKHTARLTNNEPFLLPDKLQLVFKAIGYNLSTAFVCLQNGDVRSMHVLTTPFTVPEKVLFGGALNISVKLYQKGECVKTWNCLPIILKETEFGVEVYDQLSAIEKRLDSITDTLTNAHNDLVASHNELDETVKAIKEKIKEI